MGGAEAPAGGLPWGYAIPALVFLAGVAVGVAKWAAKTVREVRREADARLAASGEAREGLRREFQERLEKCERRADDLDREFREYLAKSVRFLAQVRAAKSRDTAYPYRPPSPTLEGMKAEFLNLSQVVCPDDVRRAREDMDRTA